MYLHVHSLQVAKFKAPLFQLVAFLCPIRNSPVRLSCRVGLMSGTANEGHLGVASSLAYIYISMKFIIILLYQCVCMYIYISIYISRKQICWDPFCIFRTMLLDWPYLVGKRPPNGIGSLTEECSEKLIIISNTKCRLTYDWVIAVVVINGVIHSKNGVISTYNC